MIKEKSVLVDLAQKALQKGDVDRAISEYESVLKLDPNDFKLHNGLGDLYVKKDKIPEAIREYSLVAENEKEKGFFLKSVALYKKISRLSPDLPEPYEKMAELYTELKLHFEAKANYQWLLDYYEKKKDKRKKVEVFKKLLNLEPGNVDLRAKFAQMCIDAKMQTEASSEFVKLGTELFKRGDKKEAAILFEKAIQFNPESFTGYKWFGKCFFDEGDMDKAIQLFEKTLSLNPDDIDSLTFLAKCYCRAELDEKAIGVFIKILNLEPSLTEIRTRLARLYLKNDAIEKAKTEFIKVIDDFISKKEFSEAVKLLEGLSREVIFDYEMREKFASILKLAGEKRRAIDEYENLVKNYEYNRLYEKAIKALNKILSIDPDYPRAKERINELSKKTLSPDEKDRTEKEYSAAVKDDDGLEEIEKLLKHGLVEEAIEFLEGKEERTGKEKTEELNTDAYEGKTNDIKPKLKVKGNEEKTEGFFDLGAVLKEEMEPLEQDGKKGKKNFDEENKFLENIFTSFKENVDKEVSSEDYNTHYNLGLAYMEMELFEDAIKEFQKASKDPSIKIGVEKKFLDYCNLLGNCFIKIGLFNEAERELENGLSTHGYEARDYIPLRISKGIILENLKDYQGALSIYMDILSIEPWNKEAKKKIKELENIK